ncbi:nucleoside-diphosphate sugar epimerase/dehydratase [Undibacterium cyanobacteriorum]|uniref:Nucleoside-diphosphate sugar epimerase/dehydratase n=1 Tax=Undibacterium cyanobacteriorum TaxID=3073561 RepID=A0ABY9RDL3_9BURK|nr:nucleoside-diphosphate sugar epimerase/dehydratase [Undibacterium sp. 20NA77.5]WMW79259.1 nucleoside-diphosphate sugar epimerase/dehydratase [Undibacterium sp. 20NA77.5]
MMHALVALPRLTKQIIAALVDAVFLPLAFVLAIMTRYESVNLDLLRHYAYLIAAVPLFSIPIFIRLGLYRAVIRYIDQKMIRVVVIGVSLSVAALAFLSFMLQLTGISRAVFVIYWSGAILYVGASRLLARAYLSNVHRNPHSTKIAIYGAGKAGVQLANALHANDEYDCVAFIDDNPSLQGSFIGGVKVLAPSQIEQVIKSLQIKEILLAMPQISRARQKQILDQLEVHKVRIKVTPSIKSLVSGELRVQDIRDVEIEDLLGRDQVEPDNRLLAACITGQNVLVSGAGGSIGSELCRQILKQGPRRLVLLEMSEFSLYSIEQELSQVAKTLAPDCEITPFLGSILDQEKLTRIFTSFEIDTVYHAAAYKHVPLVEHNPIEGIRNNVFGTLQLSLAAIDAKVKQFVLISTDKAVRPTNVMGATKRLAELVLQAHARRQASTRFCMVRFGNVLGSSGSVVPLFRKQIMQGGPITLTHKEITRYFMTIPEAAQLVLQAGAMGQGGDVFVLDMGEPVRIIDLARRMVHLCGLEVKSQEHPEGTIEIHEVGLRPGEKLYEELLIGDNVTSTSHPLIMRAQEAELGWQQLQAALVQLDTACQAFDYELVRQMIQDLVPEYQPQCGIEDFIWQKKQLQ